MKWFPRDNLARGACVHLEFKSGNTRIEFREATFLSTVKKERGVKRWCLSPPWGLFPSVRNTYPFPSLWRIFLGAYAWSWLVGSVAIRIFTCFVFSGDRVVVDVGIIGKRVCVCENIFLGETKWARAENYTSVRILVHLFMEYICEYICILLFVEMK